MPKHFSTTRSGRIYSSRRRWLTPSNIRKGFAAANAYYHTARVTRRNIKNVWGAMKRMRWRRKPVIKSQKTKSKTYKANSMALYKRNLWAANDLRKHNKNHLLTTKQSVIPDVESYTFQIKSPSSRLLAILSEPFQLKNNADEKDIMDNEVPTVVNYTGVKFELQMMTTAGRNSEAPNPDTQFAPFYMKVLVVRDKYKILPGLSHNKRPIVKQVTATSFDPVNSLTDFFKNKEDPYDPHSFQWAALNNQDVINAPINSNRYQILYQKVFRLAPNGQNNLASVEDQVNFLPTTNRTQTIWIPLRKQIRYEHGTKVPLNECIKLFAYIQPVSAIDLSNEFGGYTPNVDVANIRVKTTEYYSSSKH